MERAEGTLWAYSAVGLVPCLAVKFTSTSVAQDRRLGRAKEYRIDVRFCDHASWWWRYHCLAGPPLLRILRRPCVGGHRLRRRCVDAQRFELMATVRCITLLCASNNYGQVIPLSYQRWAWAEYFRRPECRDPQANFRSARLFYKTKRRY